MPSGSNAAQIIINKIIAGDVTWKQDLAAYSDCIDPVKLNLISILGSGVTPPTTDYESDFEIGCSSVNGRPLIAIYAFENGVLKTPTLFESNGVTPVTDGSQLVKCADKDYETVQASYTLGGSQYTRITFINSLNPSDNFTTWVDSNGAVVPAAVGATPSIDIPKRYRYDSPAVPICVDGAQWYKFERVSYTDDGLSVTNANWYVSPAGTFSSTAPSGNITSGSCPAAQQTLTEAPAFYVGDNGAFIGYALKDTAGATTGWHIVSGSNPTNVDSIAYSEIPLSFTARPSASQTLNSFLTSNSNGVFSQVHVLSLTIMVTDEDLDLIFRISGSNPTVLRAGTKHSISWGNNQSYTLQKNFFDNFVFNSSAEITVSWEQAII